MKTLEMTATTAPLVKYARSPRGGPIIVTREGRPVAMLLAIDDFDLENLALSDDPKFLAIIARSRAQFKDGRGIPSADIRRRYGPKLKPGTKPRPRK